MSYSNWILSVYYEYEKICEEEKTKKEKSKKEKNTLKFKDLGTKPKIIVSILIMILGIGIYIYGAFSNNPIAYIGGLLVYIIPISIMIYTDQLPLEYYKKNIIILNEILKKEGFDNVKSIEQLIIETGGYSKIKKIREYIAIISTGSAVITSGLTYILNRIDNETIKVVFIIVIVVFWIVGIIYCILRTMPKGKMARRKEFNQLLKILLFYKQNSTKDIEDMEDMEDMEVVEDNKEISTKEIDLK